MTLDELVIFPQTHSIDTTFSFANKEQTPAFTHVRRLKAQRRNLVIELLDCEALEAKNCSVLPFFKGKLESYDYVERTYFPTQEVTVSLADNHYLFVSLRDSSFEEKFFVSTLTKGHIHFSHYGDQEANTFSEKLSETLNSKRISHGDISLTLSVH